MFIGKTRARNRSSTRFCCLRRSNDLRWTMISRRERQASGFVLGVVLELAAGRIRLCRGPSNARGSARRALQVPPQSQARGLLRLPRESRQDNCVQSLPLWKMHEAFAACPSSGRRRWQRGRPVVGPKEKLCPICRKPLPFDHEIYLDDSIDAAPEHDEAMTCKNFDTVAWQRAAI